METTTTTLIREGFEEVKRRGPDYMPQDIFGIPTFFVWNLLFVVILAVIFYWLIQGAKPHQHHDSPLDLLKKRYVNGEISKEEYEESKKMIE